MQITGAFLAEHAEIVDQKLNVTGGVLDFITVPKRGQVDDAGNPIVAMVYLVTLMQASADDHQKPYKMTTEIVEIDGSRHTFIDATIPVDAHSGENRFWVSQLGMSGGTSGRRVLVQTLDNGDSVAIPFELRVV
ncbi:hypothetical protein [Mycobacterium sp.]|uniref:hypothetical protein n=1 Tax=Mycobacterium sp. TaxID=1785 RepID=UPI0012746B05|nr:hypothetical protein [Mycobacterium sp.]KAA8946838.1 MAG: hypothetical protein F6Q13_18505 [Mycobacterium sp.]